MKIKCPTHDGTIRIGQTFINVADVNIKNLVVECPACDDEVLINGTYDFDSNGFGSRKTDSYTGIAASSEKVEKSIKVFEY